MSAASQSELVALLSGDLDFHDKVSAYASHNYHSFPAKFPPQLPLTFIAGLTNPGDVVLDPMMGSGTTVLEAWLNQRRAIGLDIDPLALRITKVKTSHLNLKDVLTETARVVDNSRKSLLNDRHNLASELSARWDAATREFVNFWFDTETQLELCSLVTQIERVEIPEVRDFLELAFSAIIITKSGGVSLALDLAHTRPHKAKTVLRKSSELQLVAEPTMTSAATPRHLTKYLRSSIEEFEKRVRSNVKGLIPFDESRFPPRILHANSQSIPLPDSSVDLIVTSPPYASNAIDYMRAHKFSLVWLGYSLNELGKKRDEYIGGERTKAFRFEALPNGVTDIVSKISASEKKKGLVLERYFSEMTRVLQEIFRVLKPGHCAIMVVGSSVMRGLDTRTHECLASIGCRIGFQVPRIGLRNLDRNRRMLPASRRIDSSSQIQQRMHQEYIIGFQKPTS